MKINLQSQHSRYIQIWVILIISGILLAACNPSPAATPTNVPPTVAPPTVTVIPPTVVPPTAVATSTGAAVNNEFANICPDMTGVVETVRQTCGGLDNQACFGQGPILAQDQSGHPISSFINPGDTYPINGFSRLEPQDRYAMAPLNANWDGFNIDLIVFGNTRIRQEAPTTTFLQQPQPRTATVRTNRRTINHRNSPGESNTNRIGTIPNGATVTHLQNSEDNQWSFISYNDGTHITYGWVAARLLSFPLAPGGNQNPVDSWQAFSVSGQTTAPNCTNAPSGGLLLQSPSGSGVSFQVNGVIVYMGSTVLIRPLTNSGVRIINIEGNVAVRDSQNLVVNVSVGHYVDVVNNGLNTRASNQISYSDGQGVDTFLTLLAMRVFVPVPPLTTNQAVDVWVCDHYQEGPGGIVLVNANQPIVLESGSGQIERNEIEELRRTVSGHVWKFGQKEENLQIFPSWGRSPISAIDLNWELAHGSYAGEDGAGGFKSIPYEPADPRYVHDPYHFVDYTVIPPQQPGSYRVEVVDWPGFCTIIVQPTPTPTPFRTLPATITLPANVRWLDTYIYLRQGQRFTINATGTTNTCPIGCPGSPDVGPQGSSLNGITCPFVELNSSSCAQNGLPYSLLLGKVGNESVFAIGNGGTFVAENSGTLRLAINDNLDSYVDNSGSLRVEVKDSP